MVYSVMSWIIRTAANTPQASARYDDMRPPLTGPHPVNALWPDGELNTHAYDLTAFLEAAPSLTIQNWPFKMSATS